MRHDLPERMPEDLDAEKSFLGTVCAPGAGPAAAEAVAGLTAEDFVHPNHRAVFRALQVVLSEGDEVSSLSLKDALGRTKELDKIGGFPSLVEILAGEDVERPQVLADVILRKSRLRKLVHAGAELTRLAATEEETPEDLIAMTSTKLADLSAAKKGKGLRFTSEVGSGAMGRILATLEGRGTPAVSTGLPRLDRMLTGGFRPGQLIVLAARPGVGKSTMARGWAKRCAALVGTAALFSLEMGSEEVWECLAGNMAGIDGERLGTGELSHAEWARFQAAKEDLDGLALLIDDQAEITVPEIRGRVDRARARYGDIHMALIDYLQLISSPKSSRSNQTEAIRIGEISRGLKLMAKDAGLPVVVLSQLNREIEKGNGRRPNLSDLRDSGAIEQDADIVIFIHRRGEGGDASYELIVAKHRGGKTGTIHLQADLSTYTFKELDREVLPPVRLQSAACDGLGD
jgi:replicative DNA helicase